MHLPLLFSFFSFLFIQNTSSSVTDGKNPAPADWPMQFHAVLFMNRSGILQKTDLWYDWPNGRNFNIIQHQLGVLNYDLEWDNGTSFYYTLEPFEKTCKVFHFDVGILRPDWLNDANYLGQRNQDSFLCNVWEKADFITYYEDVRTRRPVYWVFKTSGMTAHVMTFEVGAVLDHENWQAPVYCFSENRTQNKRPSKDSEIQSFNVINRMSMRNNRQRVVNSLNGVIQENDVHKSVP
nr:PREDICTED: uncharacterized protein At4g14100-like [Bemisia tabaci]